MLAPAELYDFTDLTIREDIPDGLLDVDATRLHEVLTGPTLFHLPGRRARPLYVSVLLHGNETTGWETVRALLARHAGRTLPRALTLFVGNVAAARWGLRRLDGQPDYNRVWRGEGTREHRTMAQILAIMKERGTFACVDIHNNTGVNPHYACVNELEPPFLHLATLFSRTVVYSNMPNTVQTLAFAAICPSVTIECGQPGQPHGVEHALEFLDACLHLSEFPSHQVAAGDIDLFHTVATVKVPAHLSFGFGNGEDDIRFVEDLDRLNFRELPQGTLFGTISDRTEAPLEVWGESGADVSAQYFELRDRELVTAQAVMPSMLTRDTRIVRQDCLCYLMERYHL